MFVVSLAGCLALPHGAEPRCTFPLKDAHLRAAGGCLGSEVGVGFESPVSSAETMVQSARA